MEKCRTSIPKTRERMVKTLSISRSHSAIPKRTSKNVGGSFHAIVASHVPDSSCAGLKITDYPKNIGEVQHSVIFDTLEILEKSGVVQAPEGGWKLDTFVDPEIAKVI